MYIDLDKIIQVEKCPDITDMIADSVDYIRHNCNIRTFDLEQNQINEIITEERKLIENNKKLIQKFQNKISEKIDKILSN